MTDPTETCERCQMKLPRSWGVMVPGVRGSLAWRCAACLPPADLLILGLVRARDEVITIRKQRLAGGGSVPTSG